MRNLLILIVAVIFTVFSAKAEPELEDDQIENISNYTKAPVPGYRFVSLKTSSRRNGRELRPIEIEIDGTKTQLSLTPVEHNVMSSDMTVWSVAAEPGPTTGIPIRVFQKLNPEDTTINGVYYEDSTNMALLFAHYNGRQIYYDGRFGEGTEAKVVESVREKTWRGAPKEADHVIYDVEEPKINSKPIEANVTPNKFMDKPLEVMYPKLLIVIENNYFKLLGGDVAKAMKYIGTFWNAVNLKYREIASPKVKIMITGIIIESEEYMLPYIFEARNRTDLAKLNSNLVMRDAGSYFKEISKTELDFHNYDSVITISNLDSGSIGGQAWLGQICSDTMNNAFVQDDGSYKGVLPATHELAHLLSIPHDGTSEAKECGGALDYDLSTVMAPYVKSARTFSWSDCSKNILDKFAWSKTAECMKDTYHY